MRDEQFVIKIAAIQLSSDIRRVIWCNVHPQVFMLLEDPKRLYPWGPIILPIIHHTYIESDSPLLVSPLAQVVIVL